MAKTANININIDRDLKEEATYLFDVLGLNMTTAITVFLKMSVLMGGLPFEVKAPKPSKELQHALDEGEKILSGEIKTKSYDNVQDLFDDITKE